MWRAALAWVASASSSSGGAKSEAKKIASQTPNRIERAVERRGVRVIEIAGDSVEVSERIRFVMSLAAAL